MGLLFYFDGFFLFFEILIFSIEFHVWKLIALCIRTTARIAQHTAPHHWWSSKKLWLSSLVCDTCEKWFTIITMCRPNDVFDSPWTWVLRVWLCFVSFVLFCLEFFRALFLFWGNHLHQFTMNNGVMCCVVLCVCFMNLFAFFLSYHCYVILWCFNLKWSS